MELWTEYEGKTIDGAFPLKKLVAPQGRSALFSTANAKGEQTLIRLVACHFDEDEILARWRGVEVLKHPNFLRLERYGQLELDQTRVVYAAFERTDANLAQVLAQGCLSVSDVRQLASNLASALEMLHANGFVHEHIMPESVFAVGEVVKLRTDCIRETPEGLDGEQARKRDLRDLALLLLHALTQETSLESATQHRRRIPAPFDQIIPGALSGTLTLAQISATLQPARPADPKPAAKTAPLPPPSTRPSAAPTETRTSSKSSDDPLKPAALRSQTLPEAWREDGPSENRKWIGAAVAAAVILLLLWAGMAFYHHRAAGISTAKVVAPPRATHRPTAAPKPIAHPSAPAATGAKGEVWRVIAYTYDHRDQAQKKSAEIAQRNPNLQPSVFSPTGRRPYLVTIGGAMTRQQAYALAHRATRIGLPRDTYARNYKNTR